MFRFDSNKRIFIGLRFSIDRAYNLITSVSIRRFPGDGEHITLRFLFFSMKQKHVINVNHASLIDYQVEIRQIKTCRIFILSKLISKKKSQSIFFCESISFDRCRVKSKHHVFFVMIFL